MNEFERHSVSNALAQLKEQVLSDMGKMPKALRKKAHKDRIKALQNNAFKKDKK